MALQDFDGGSDAVAWQQFAPRHDICQGVQFDSRGVDRPASRGLEQLTMKEEVFDRNVARSASRILVNGSQCNFHEACCEQHPSSDADGVRKHVDTIPRPRPS